MSYHDMPQVGDNLASLVNSRTKRFSLGGPTVNMNLPNQIFVHHIHHDNKIKPIELRPSPMISMID